MAVPIVMPQVGQDLTEGKLIEWNVKVGDTVKKNDILAIVESEKASFEVEAYEEGVVLKLLYEAGDMATVLEPLLFLGKEGETLDGDSGGDSSDGSGTEKAEAAPQPKQAEPEIHHGNGHSSSPLARRLALKNNIDISKITGTGPKGSVVKRDIEQALKSAPAGGSAATVPAPAAPAALSQIQITANTEDTEVPFNRMRQIIADRLALSKQTIPHFYLKAEVDVTNLQIRRKAHLEMTGEKVSLNDVIVHATALTLLEFPQLNAHVSSDRVILKGNVNIGVAVSVDDGLMVPAIEDTPFKKLSEVSALIRDYATAARRGMNKSMAKSTFSISNLGMYGVEVVPIINPPEAGILGVGPVTRQIREHQGGIQGRDILSLALAVDHRAVDGAYGARFLQALRESIETYNDFS